MGHPILRLVETGWVRVVLSHLRRKRRAEGGAPRFVVVLRRDKDLVDEFHSRRDRDDAALVAEF
jgi:hypothetical protein